MMRLVDASELPTQLEPPVADGALDEGTETGSCGTRRLVLAGADGARVRLAPPAVLGRGQDCDVRLAKSRRISRRHASIEEVQGRFLIIDLGSANGTYLNGQRIPAQRYVELVDHDVLRLADEEFSCVIEAEGSGDAGL